ncbi:LysR family transcriptional regulator [Ancylobacter terrae]|uniref:LysR family transcriptional regulator n=1 Tax=Ancylobacter sp. sgz301288 TaxID=3342077 RepID=UPI0038594ECC
MIAWDDFRLVKAIAEAHSLAGAAETLGVNHSTIFRRLGSLEEALGTRLFERARTGYAPTAAGEEMVRVAERMAEEIVTLERRITGQDLRPSGDLRVTTNDTLLMHLLTPLLVDFRKAYPDIRLEIIVSNASLNLSKRDADVAVRATQHPPETLIGRRTASIRWAVYSRPEMVGPDGYDHARARDFHWVGFADNLANLPPAAWLHDHVGEERIMYRVDTVMGLAEAAQAGAGLALLPCFIGSATPGLVRLTEPEEDINAGLWLLTHPDLRGTARVRAFMEHIGRELAKRRDFIEGRTLAA